MFYSDCIVLKLCVVFLQLVTMAKKKAFIHTKPDIAPIEVSVKKAYFLRLQNFGSQATTQRICCLLCRKMNPSTII